MGDTAEQRLQRAALDVCEQWESNHAGYVEVAAWIELRNALDALENEQ